MQCECVAHHFFALIKFAAEAEPGIIFSDKVPAGVQYDAALSGNGDVVWYVESDGINVDQDLAPSLLPCHDLETGQLTTIDVPGFKRSLHSRDDGNRLAFLLDGDNDTLHRISQRIDACTTSSMQPIAHGFKSPVAICTRYIKITTATKLVAESQDPACRHTGIAGWWPLRRWLLWRLGIHSTFAGLGRNGYLRILCESRQSEGGDLRIQ